MSDTPSTSIARDARFDALCAELADEFRTFRLVPKHTSPVMRLCARVLLMRLWNPAFMQDYTTVLGARVYMPARLIGTAAGYRTLRHERVHMRDFFRFGVLPFVLTYLFVLPAGLTLRAVWEMRAYEETLRATFEETGEVPEALLGEIARRFCGPDYLYMCPFPRLVDRWLRRVRARVVAVGRG